MLLLLAESMMFLAGLMWLMRGRVEVLDRVLEGRKARLVGALLMAPPILFIPLGVMVGLQYGASGGSLFSAEFIYLMSILGVIEIGVVIGIILICARLIFFAPRITKLAATPKIPENKRIFTVREAAEYLQITETEVLQLIEVSKIPAGRFGDGYRIARDVLDEYLLQSPHHTPETL